jgi:hypothetical protein
VLFASFSIRIYDLTYRILPFKVALHTTCPLCMIVHIDRGHLLHQQPLRLPLEKATIAADSLFSICCATDVLVGFSRSDPCKRGCWKAIQRAWRPGLRVT